MNNLDNGDYIDLNVLPTHKDKRNYGKPDWENSVGIDVPFRIKDVVGCIKIIKYIKKSKVIIEYNGRSKIYGTDSIKNMRFYKFLKNYSNSYKFNIGDIINNCKIIDRKSIILNGTTNKYYKYQCLKCGFNCGEHYKNQNHKDEFWILEYNLIQEQFCACCSSRIVVEGINDIPTTTPWMVKYFQGGYNEAKLYTCNSNHKINFRCPDCKTIKNKEMAISTLYRTKTISCVCSDGISYPEKIMYNLLNQLNIDFDYQKYFKWCKFSSYGDYNKISHGLYDFILNKYNLIIEMDGGLGHGNKPNKYIRNNVNQDIYKDKMKDKLAYDNGYKVIRIDCKISNLDYIKNNIMNSDLKHIINMENVSWNSIDALSINNLAKEVCDFYNKYNFVSISFLCDKYKFCRSTILNYLHKGTKYKWCDYVLSESMSRSVVLYDSNNSFINIFTSVKELEEKSFELYRIHFNKWLIMKYCLANKKYKGFMFKYYQDNMFEDMQNQTIVTGH